MPEALIDLEGVTVTFEGQTVLENVNFKVFEKDYVGIIGPNGSGKTTLLKVILGLIIPDKGKVSIIGSPPSVGRKYVGYVPQYLEFDKTFPINVREFALMGRLSSSSLVRRFNDDDRRKTDEALGRVGLLDLKEKQLGVLSGGERQRAYIARALASEPKILLLDEPTANIDVKMEKGFYELLAELRKEVAIVLVSHDVGIITVNVDKIACVNRQLFMHHPSEINEKTLEETYKCPVEMIAHGVPHRVLKDHEHGGDD